VNLEIFKENIIVLNDIDGERARKRYIETFVDTKGEFYKTYIQKRHKYIDGYCYTGYLWDILYHKIAVSEEYIQEIAKNMNDIYVFWDIHSCERILIEDYWKFEKNNVLKMNISTLILGLDYLPEDIYIFDEKCKWSFIFTHEYTDNHRYCLLCGDI